MLVGVWGVGRGRVGGVERWCVGGCEVLGGRVERGVEGTLRGKLPVRCWSGTEVLLKISIQLLVRVAFHMCVNFFVGAAGARHERHQRPRRLCALTSASAAPKSVRFSIMGSVYSRCAQRVAMAASGEAKFLDLRVEETAIVAGVFLILAYCTAIYATVWTVAYPIRLVVGYCWDAALGSAALLLVAGRLVTRPPSRQAIASMPDGAEQDAAKKARKQAGKAAATRQYAALAFVATTAFMRWRFGSLLNGLQMLQDTV